MVQSIFIPHKFPSLNDYIDAERKNRFMAAKIKKDETELAASYFKKLPSIDEPVFIQFVWREANTRRDPDNIIFAKKFILDGMVAAGYLPNDTQKWITGFDETWTIDKEKPGVEVILNW